MAIHVALKHVTHYRYDRLVNLAPQVVRLRPAPHCRTPILSYSLRIVPHVSSSIELVQSWAKFELAFGTGGSAVVPDARLIVPRPCCTIWRW